MERDDAQSIIVGNKNLLKQTDPDVLEAIEGIFESMIDVEGTTTLEKVGNFFTAFKNAAEAAIEIVRKRKTWRDEIKQAEELLATPEPEPETPEETPTEEVQDQVTEA